MFADIDWTRPWFDTVRPAFESLAAGPFIDTFNANAARLGLANAGGQPIRFVPQAELPEGMAYEAFIGATGRVPTRANLHDFFNGLVWQTFPRIKRALNALQAAQIAQAGVGKSRGSARDAATIFDENAALLVVRGDAEGRALVDDLRAHRWRDALFDKRAMFGRDAEPWLFGHALMEKLVAPRKAITAHVRVVFATDDFFAFERDGRRDWIDVVVSKEIAAEGLSTAGFTPLPVLGVPGWWPDQGEAFYLDHTVFRPKRPASQPQGGRHD
ncbi:DUF3025 domain-containing protein [Massilia rhizosphaerae]|uniref:DUF3025 domain-containing protein n=1 Tax=Massilia rhizosphaerae TaxID=2784389 RepID=UPI0018DDC031|nr:DUF3025 domain-containing protein [Massilia rhizosphaerae]